ncbi:MAG: carboxypeptidase-like regulatory domain-containing protein [Bacteroidota bacterium]
MKHIYISISFVVLFSISLGSWAQESQRISSVLVNAETNEPVAFATVGIPRLGVGVSSNEQGYFSLPIARFNPEDIFTVTHIGYQPYSTQLSELIKNVPDTIRLQPEATTLTEIVIKDKKESVEDLVRRAAKNFSKHLGTKPYLLFSYYKELVRSNGEYTGYTDAYGIMHIGGYKRSNYEGKKRILTYDLAQWKNIRRSEYRLSDDCDTSANRKLSIYKLLKAKSEAIYNGPFDPSRMKNLRYEIDSLTNYQGDQVYIISYEPKEGSTETISGKLLLKADDFALLKLELNNLDGKEINDPKCGESTGSYSFSMGFSYFNDQYYLNHAGLVNQYTSNSGAIEEQVELYGKEFREMKTQRLNYDQRNILFQEMNNPLVTYQEELWNSNILGQEAFGSDLENAFGGSEEFKGQFEFNNGRRLIPLPEGYSDYSQIYKDKDVYRLFLGGIE